MNAGYSSRPLAAKLGLPAAGPVTLIGAAPDWYRDLVGRPALDLGGDPEVPGPFVHLFATQSAALAPVLGRLRARMPPDGILWVSWPKKAANPPTDLTEDAIRACALPLGLVDIKVCAVDGNWSGLKLMIRRALRNAAWP